MGTLANLVRSFRVFHRELKRIGPPAEPIDHIPSIGLALGGGFARGLAHIGVLKVLEEENIPILLSELPAFEVAGRLYQMGILGKG